tara:strand:+ start:4229 stop:4348 length:120 start_codon:yes stop_codon:yes gene_type:complete
LIIKIIGAVAYLRWLNDQTGTCKLIVLQQSLPHSSWAIH